GTARKYGFGPLIEHEAAVHMKLLRVVPDPEQTLEQVNVPKILTSKC
ncbi:MAG: hypothetical protein K0Q80_2672, partial [Microvirga sp.]|nr:hypothetical protein [Microvirga sp.]